MLHSYSTFYRRLGPEWSASSAEVHSQKTLKQLPSAIRVLSDLPEEQISHFELIRVNFDVGKRVWNRVWMSIFIRSPPHTKNMQSHNWSSRSRDDNWANSIRWWRTWDEVKSSRNKWPLVKIFLSHFYWIYILYICIFLHYNCTETTLFLAVYSDGLYFIPLYWG